MDKEIYLVWAIGTYFLLRRLLPKPETSKWAISSKHRLKKDWQRRQRLTVFRHEASPKLSNTLAQVKRVVAHDGHGWQAKHLVIAMVAGAAMGAWVGSLIENTLMAIILCFCGALLPYFYLEYRIRGYEWDRNEKLLIVMSSLQAEYLKPHVPFIHAVTTVLPTIPDPLYRPFKRYADTINLFHPDSPIEALRELEGSINNYFFTEYISLTRLVEEGEQGLKATMSSIPVEYQGYLETNRAFAYQVADYNHNFQMTLLTFPMMVGFLRVTSLEYYEILTHHPVGKVTLIILTVLNLTAAVIFNRLNSSVQLEL